MGGSNAWQRIMTAQVGQYDKRLFHHHVTAQNITKR